MLRGRDVAVVALLVWLLATRRTAGSETHWSWEDPDTGADLPGDLPADAIPGDSYCDSRTNRCFYRDSFGWVEVIP